MNIETIVKNWRNVFEMPVNSHDILTNLKNITSDDILLDFRLIEEELAETKKAMFKYNETAADKDMVEIFDGIGDVIVTLWQLFSRIGLNTEDITKIVETVTNSNMSKGITNQEDLEATIKHYSDLKVNTALKLVKLKDKNTMILVYRDDGKLLKNVNYKLPNFTKFIHNTKQISKIKRIKLFLFKVLRIKTN